MEKIQFIGLGEFRGYEKNIIKEITYKHLNKISRELKNFLLIVSLKKHSNAKKTLDQIVKYSARAKIEMPNILINASYADWDLRRTMHRMYEKLLKEIQHKFKTNKKSWVRKRHKNA